MKTITKEQYLIALGLMQVAGEHLKMVESCEEALGNLLGQEKSEYGGWGHCSDEIFGNRNVDALLSRLDITVEEGV